MHTLPQQKNYNPLLRRGRTKETCLCMLFLCTYLAIFMCCTLPRKQTTSLRRGFLFPSFSWKCHLLLVCLCPEGAMLLLLPLCPWKLFPKVARKTMAGNILLRLSCIWIENHIKQDLIVASRFVHILKVFMARSVFGGCHRRAYTNFEEYEIATF